MYLQIKQHLFLHIGQLLRQTHFWNRMLCAPMEIFLSKLSSHHNNNTNKTAHPYRSRASSSLFTSCKCKHNFAARCQSPKSEANYGVKKFQGSKNRISRADDGVVKRVREVFTHSVHHTERAATF